MAQARKTLLDLTRPGWVHAINRCVRRAWLCGLHGGKDFGHRRQWVEDRLAEVARVFACEVAAFSVMANHLHVVVRMAPEMAAGWSADEVAERWCLLFGKTLPKGADGAVDRAVVRGLAARADWVAERRRRLGDLSWFMRALAEDIARRANREDDCTGRFWEGRFTSVPLLDQSALIACMAYVDLNPIRAKLADRPERSTHTSVRRRVRARQGVRRAARTGVPAPAAGAREDAWLAPLDACVCGPVRPFSVDDYLTLVDASGRLIAGGKRGRIPPELAPILQRLDLELEDWVATLFGWRSMIGGALGHYASRVAEAERRQVAWVRNRCPLFAA